MTDLTKIIKRLELIKNLIFLEDVEDIAEQITKFKHFEANEDVRNIIALLQQKAFKNAIIAIDIFLSKYNQAELKLIPYRKADKWGFCTSDKKIIIDCIYSYVKNFADGLAMVEGNCNYNSVKGILEYPLGFINMKGELVIDCLYSRAASFSEGLAAVEINNKWGFIDRNGQLAIPLMYRNAESFFDELARVTLNDQSFLINKKNETVSIYDFSEGMAKTIKNNKWGFIDRNQNLAIPCIYDKVENFSEGLARVYKNNKSGFTDKTGELVVPFIYDLTSDFSNGYATVRLNTGWGIINRTGELIFFEKGFSVSPGSFQRVNSEIVLYIRYNFTTWGFMNLKGENLAPCVYHVMYAFVEGMARVRKGSTWGFLNSKGIVVIPCVYEDANDFSGGLATVQKNDKWGVINIKGEIISPFIYDLAYSCGEERIAVRKNDKWGCIDTNGNLVISCIYDQIADFKNGVASVKLYENDDFIFLGYIGINGIEYWED